MSIGLVIAGVAMDIVEGEILLPQRSTERFVTPGAPHAGIQVLPVQGSPFTLQVTRYTPAGQLQAEADWFRSLIGNVVRLRFNSIEYDLLPYRLRFAVLDTQLTESRVIPFASGSRAGVPYQFAPAGIVRVSVTLQSVPL